MALLDVVRHIPDVKLIVAHVDHGIREDATEDAKLVQTISMSHNIAYESIRLRLGSEASEERARTARYDFLRHLRKKHNALAILTAHHKDDLLETAVLNILRGTGWRGLSSLRSTDELIRPFLGYSKHELEAYASEHKLQWRYDSTNDDQRYLRNKIRHQIMPKLTDEARQKLYQYIVRQSELTKAIDDEAATWLKNHVQIENNTALLPRYEFLMMPQHVAHELLQTVLRRIGGKSLPRPLVDRALLFSKVAKAHKTFPLDASWQLRSLPRKFIVERRPLMVSLENAGGPTRTKQLNKE
jgi:tRNA(Ile)-lysidine synthase